MAEVERIGGRRFVVPDGRRRAESPGDRLADHLPDLRARLEEQRRFRLEQLAEPTPSTEAAGVAGTVVDAARREVSLAVAAAARQALLDIEIALDLIEVGGYGRCRGCRTDIPLLLLRTIPTSRWCLDCGRRRTPADGLGSRRPRQARDATTGPRHHGTRRTAAAR